MSEHLPNPAAPHEAAPTDELMPAHEPVAAGERLPLRDVERWEVERLEERLRAELAAAASGVVRLTPAAAVVPSVANGSTDPLDEFFWHEDEIAPTLPDVVSASALPVAEPIEVRREWLTFHLGVENYAIEIEHVREVLKAPPFTEVPRAPAHIMGVIMVRGEVIAVLDPRVLLGLPRGDPGPRARVLVCDTGVAVCGIVVDAVSHVVRLAPSAIEARPAGVGAVAADHIVGIGRQRNQLFVLLDAVSLLTQALPARAPVPGSLP